jgi:hypothetical protein
VWKITIYTRLRPPGCELHDSDRPHRARCTRPSKRPRSRRTFGFQELNIAGPGRVTEIARTDGKGLAQHRRPDHVREVRWQGHPAEGAFMPHRKLVRSQSGSGGLIFAPGRNRRRDAIAPLRRRSMQPGCRPRTGGCAQCAHPGLRIGSYWRRTGPDCGGFWGSGGCTRAGTRFESHLGHVFSLFRGLWVFFRVHVVHTPATETDVPGVWGPGIDLFGCGGGAAGYGGPRTALWGLFWVFILVRPSVGFSRSPLHGVQRRVQHDLPTILSIDRGVSPVRNFRSDTCSCRSAGELHLATDPELTMGSLSLASGRRAGFEGEL